MLFAPVQGGLELRQEGSTTVIVGWFPYGEVATLSDTGRPRREVFAPGAFHARTADPEAEIHLLSGHDFNRPLASRKGGSLTLQETPEGLAFEARIPPEVTDTTHARDALALIRSGLAVGLSPGFRVPPNGATVEERDGGLLRTIREAQLFELSIVTRPAYEAAQVEARSWTPTRPAAPVHALRRWMP